MLSWYQEGSSSMSDEHESPAIKVTDRRHFDKSGQKRPGDDASDVSPDAPPEPVPSSAPRANAPSPGSDSAKQPARESTAGQPPVGKGGPRSSNLGGAGAAASPSDLAAARGSGSGQISGDLSDVALGLSSSFSLLIARLAQETEIYLGLVPYPGKETAEPDLEAARAMIDVLTMLQEKTRGNLDEQESDLLENLLYTYRLEFVRRRSGGEIR